MGRGQGRAVISLKIGGNHMDAIKMELPAELQQATIAMINKAVDQAIKDITSKNSFPPFMTQQEACKYLHIAPSTFNKWQGTYNIPVVQIEGIKRYKRSSLDEFMKQLEK